VQSQCGRIAPSCLKSRVMLQPHQNATPTATPCHNMPSSGNSALESTGIESQESGLSHIQALAPQTAQGKTWLTVNQAGFIARHPHIAPSVVPSTVTLITLYSTVQFACTLGHIAVLLKFYNSFYITFMQSRMRIELQPLSSRE
jgi:hypothetical protein